MDYLKPATLAEALDALDESRHVRCVAYAGGTDVIPRLKARFINPPEVLLDLKGIRELDFMTCDDHSGLRIGALATISSLVASESVRKRYPALLQGAHGAAEEKVHALTRVADALPGFGIFGAVLGIVITMSSLGGPVEEIGHHVAAALVGTFLGILLAYGFVGPMSIAMEHKANEEAKFFEVIKTCLLASVQGYNSKMVVEFGRKAMPVHLRPGFAELEEHIRGSKA